MLLMYADVEVMTTFATWMKPGPMFVGLIQFIPAL
jgi:hypothetical protein